MNPLPDNCPKCGHEGTSAGEGYSAWVGPKYSPHTDTLVWRCRQCGFLVDTPCADAGRTVGQERDGYG
jgi:rubrerythrin